MSDCFSKINLKKSKGRKSPPKSNQIKLIKIRTVQEWRKLSLVPIHFMVNITIEWTVSVECKFAKEYNA